MCIRVCDKQTFLWNVHYISILENLGPFQRLNYSQCQSKTVASMKYKSSFVAHFPVLSLRCSPLMNILSYVHRDIFTCLVSSWAKNECDLFKFLAVKDANVSMLYIL